MAWFIFSYCCPSVCLHDPFGYWRGNLKNRLLNKKKGILFLFVEPVLSQREIHPQPPKFDSLGLFERRTCCDRRQSEFSPRFTVFRRFAPNFHQDFVFALSRFSSNHCNALFFSLPEFVPLRGETNSTYKVHADIFMMVPSQDVHRSTWALALQQNPRPKLGSSSLSVFGSSAKK